MEEGGNCSAKCLKSISEYLKNTKGVVIGLRKNDSFVKMGTVIPARFALDLKTGRKLNPGNVG